MTSRRRPLDDEHFDFLGTMQNVQLEISSESDFGDQYMQGKFYMILDRLTESTVLKNFKIEAQTKNDLCKPWGRYSFYVTLAG